jgi:hypothetical protein
MLSRLPRGDQVVGEALSALWPADGPARSFFPHLLGWVVAGGGGVDCLHFLRGVSAVEPDALKGVAPEAGKHYAIEMDRAAAVHGKLDPCVELSGEDNERRPKCQ